jgi:hypothetical protein
MYFVHTVHEAERPKTREEQLAYNARSGSVAAGLRDLRASLAARARRIGSFTTRGRGIQISTARYRSRRPAPGQTAPHMSASGRTAAGRELVGSTSGRVRH